MNTEKIKERNISVYTVEESLEEKRNYSRKKINAKYV